MLYHKKMTKTSFNIAKYLNTDYMKPVAEWRIGRLCASEIERIPCRNNRVLLIATSLIGDFVASIPAIFDFIQRNPDKKIDIIVSPVLKELARGIHGVGNIYTAKSVTDRSIENIDIEKQLTPHSYELVIILRSSKDVLDNMTRQIKAEETRYIGKEFARYSLVELVAKTILGQRPKSWNEFNFELL